jgi:ATP-dependent Lon protease
VPAVSAAAGAILASSEFGATSEVRTLVLLPVVDTNAVQVAELAIEKQAQTLLMPVSARRQLNELPDELWTKINVEFYRDVVDAVFKALEE